MEKPAVATPTPSSPGPHHAALNAFVGTFSAACKLWMGPDQPPIEYSGLMTNTWVLGGRFLRQEFAAALFGGNFEGLGYWGYNNHAGRYEGVWIDTASTLMQTETGARTDSGDGTAVFTMQGQLPSPHPEGGTMTKRTVITKKNNNEHLFELYFTFPGKPEYKVMQAAYTRTKS